MDYILGGLYMRNKRVHGGAVAGSVIIAIIITILLMAGTGLVIMNNVFNEKFISKTVSSIRIEQLEIPITIEGETYNNISEALVEQVNKSMDANLTEEDVSQFFDESGISELVGEKLTLGLEAVMNGEEISLITNEELMNFIKDNEQLVEDTFDIEITEDDLDKVEDKIEEFEIEETFNTQIITTTITDTDINPIFELVNAFRKFFSVGAIVIVYVATALLWLGIFFLNKRQLWYAGPYLGVPAIIVGVGNAISAVVIKVASSFVPEEVGKFLKDDIFDVLVELPLIIAIIHVVVGIAITVASAVVKKNLAKKEENNTELEYSK